MSRVLWLLVLLAALAGAAQATLPGVLDRTASAALEPLTGGASRDQVAVVAVPFWTLADGRFQDLQVNGSNWLAAGLRLATVRVNWENGGLNVADLLQRHMIVPTTLGHMTVRITVDGPALARFLDASGKVQQAQVTVAHGTVSVSGRVSLNGLTGRVSTRGTLAVASNRQDILFRPNTFDGVGLPFGASLSVFSLSSLNVPVPLALQSVTVMGDRVVVEAATP